MGKLTALIDRLEAASEGSRELDREMMLLVGDAREVDHCTFYGPEERVWCFGEYEHETDLPPLPYLTSSLDAIVALIERKLPGWFWGIGRRSDADDPAKPMWAEVASERWIKSETEKDEQFESDGVTAPLALCVVLLRALQAQQETSEDE